jgi:hypothetical protein
MLQKISSILQGNIETSSINTNKVSSFITILWRTFQHLPSLIQSIALLLLKVNNSVFTYGMKTNSVRKLIIWLKMLPTNLNVWTARIKPSISIQTLTQLLDSPSHYISLLDQNSNMTAPLMKLIVLSSVKWKSKVIITKLIKRVLRTIF